MLRSLTLLCFTVLYATLLTGQVQLPTASAAAFAYGKYADIPVSTFTGVGNVQVPIHTVTDGPLALPISLNYHTGGLQVNVPASSVGWGWNLNTGGMISRTIKGVSDFDPSQQGYYYRGGEVRAPTDSDDKVWDYDTEPDIFTFTVGSYSGKFFFDANREIQQIPKSDIKINLLSPGAGVKGFELITPDGTKYSYGARFKPGAGHEVITAHDYSKVNGDSWWDEPDKEEDCTGYYLLSVESADRKHRIDLEYERMKYWYVTQRACAEEFKYRKNNGNIDEVATCEEGWMDYSIKSVYLKRIWTDNQEVTFQQETRNDVWTSQTDEARKPKRVRGITVETSGECINLNLLGSYFYDKYGNKVRTKLDGVQKKSCDGSLVEPAWKFSYLGPKNGTNAVAPRIGNHDIDHWGYYNYDPNKGHNDQDGDLTPQGTGMEVGGTFTPYGTANRESHEPAMLQGMLHTVTYPTGGSMTLDYEANRYQIAGPSESGFSRGHTSLAGEPESSATFSYYHSAEIADSPNAVWTMCVYPYSGDDGGGGPTDPRDPQYLKGPESSHKSVSPPSSTSATGGSGTVEIRTQTGDYVTGFSFNTTGRHCQPNSYMSSHLTPGTTYDVIIIAESARVTVDLNYEEPPSDAICGGLRIKQTRVHDGISAANDIITDYEYSDAEYPNASSGQLFRKPTYAFRVNYRTAVFTSMSQVPLFEVDGLHLGYERVVVSQRGNGETEYRYKFPTRTQDYTTYPVRPTTNELGVGELIGSTVFDEDGQTLTHASTIYRQDERESFGAGSAAGYFFVKRKGVPYYSGGLDYKNLYTPYWMTTGVRRPSTVTATVDGVSTTTNYTYHLLNLLPETVTSTNSNGDEYQQRHYFFDPSSLPFSGITQEEWEELNLKHLSYQTEQYYNGDLVDGSKIDYRFYKADGTSPSTSATDRVAMPRVYRQQRYERTYAASGSLQSGRWDTYSTIAQYNSYGQVREQQVPHWPSTTVGFRGDLPVSSTSNGQTTTYVYEGEETSATEDDTRRLRQVIAVDGTSTSYTYDSFGRVKTITDDCQGITTTYTYTFRHDNQSINYLQSEVVYPTTDSRSALTTTKTRKYTDGLGRPLQTVAIGAGTSAQDDIVAGVAYDRFGRVSKSFESVGRSNNQGDYVSLAGSLPGTVHTYEPSPLNRPRTITPAGLAYPSTYSYGTNTATDKVMRDGTTVEYAAGSLRKSTITDANGNHLVTFTDKMGQQVLSRRLPASGSTSDRLDTYTIYDGKGRVRHVLPPGSTTSHTNLIYSYQYDGGDQVTKKLVPGRGWTEYMYNSKHLLHGYRDEYLKQAGHWYAYNYDSKGRTKAEGIYKHSTLYWFAAPNLTEPLITTTYGTDPHEIDRVKTVRTKILDGGDQWLTTTNHYTTCGLLDYQTGNNHLNVSASERTDYIYDGAGNVVESTYGHRDYNQVVTNVTSEHHYDFAGRTYRSYFQVGGGPKTQLNELAFTATGQVATKYQGGTGKSGTLAWLQKLDYTYLDNGMLQGINLNGLTGTTQGLPDFYDYDRDVHDPNPGMPSTADMDAKDLFYVELYRDQAPATNSYNLPARYNGDITAVATQVRGRTQQVWGMTYDGYDRMRDARFYQRGNRTATANYTSRYRATVSYDERGNISRLDRRGMYVYPDYWKYKQIDRLTYAYAGVGTEQTNQLRHITEGADDNLGYRERSTDYAYDANGNLSYDVQRNADIVYNHLNLPVSIAYRNGTAQRVEFIYDATGTLLTRRGFSQNNVEEDRVDYVGGIAYRNGQINTVQHEEGRVYLGDGDQRYDYTLSDHLGNVRLMYSDFNGNGIPEVPNEIVEEAHYYPFGMRMSGPWMASARGNVGEYMKHQYNGIERVNTYGLGLNMAFYRTLDPITGRWWQVDPKAEHDFAGTPYGSMYNSPMVYADPMGDEPITLAAIAIGMAIGAGTHTASHLIQNNGTFQNWNWGAFAGSIVAGGIGAGVSGALANAGIGGFAGGFGTGAASGLAQSTISGLINKNLDGGVIAQSTLMGGLIGGTISGIGAAIDGRNFGDGSKLLETDVLASDLSIADVKQNAKYNCGPACGESIDGTLTQDNIRDWFGGNPSTTGIGDTELWQEFADRTGRHLTSTANLGDPATVASSMNSGAKIVATLRNADVNAAGHSVVLKSVTKRTFEKLNGKIVHRYSVGIMNPSVGHVTSRSWGSMSRVNRFFILR